MNQYMLDIDLPEDLNDDFMARIPEQRAHITDLMNRGVVTMYSLSEDRSKLWATMVGEDEDEIMEILSSFPLVEYFEIAIYPLVIHESTPINIPPISLN